MIKTYSDLKRYLKEEKEIYVGNSKLQIFKLSVLKTEDYLIWRYFVHLRKAEYHNNTGHRFRYFFRQCLKNRIGRYVCIASRRNNFEIGVRIWHSGITINGNAKIGEYCQLHGDNCIGNKGGTDTKAPSLGRNVDVGIGAKL